MVDDAYTNAELDPPPVGSLSEGSILGTFKQELDELASATSVTIPVAGYEKTGLQIEYRMPENGKELADIENRVRKQTKNVFERNISVAIDTMITLCEGLYVQPEDVPEPVILDPENTGEPCGFDHRLAELMGMTVTPELRARAIVRKLFANNDLALLSHAEKLSRWLQNTKADLESEMWQGE